MGQVSERVVRIRTTISNSKIVDAQVFDAADQPIRQHVRVVVRETVVVADVVVFRGNVGPPKDVVGILGGSFGAGTFQTALHALVPERCSDGDPCSYLSAGAGAVTVAAARQGIQGVIR